MFWTSAKALGWKELALVATLRPPVAAPAVQPFNPTQSSPPGEAGRLEESLLVSKESSVRTAGFLCWQIPVIAPCSSRDELAAGSTDSGHLSLMA